MCMQLPHEWVCLNLLEACNQADRGQRSPVWAPAGTSHADERTRELAQLSTTAATTSHTKQIGLPSDLGSETAFNAIKWKKALISSNFFGRKKKKEKASLMTVTSVLTLFSVLVCGWNYCNSITSALMLPGPGPIYGLGMQSHCAPR